MDSNTLFTIIDVVIVVGAFLVGKFVIPRLNANDASTFSTILKWVEAFVISAKNLMSTASGEEKKAAVTEQVKNLLSEKKLTLTDDQISALIEKAYDTVVASIPTAPKATEEATQPATEAK